MNESTKTAVKSGAIALASLCLASYFHRRKETVEETVCDIVCGCASTIVLGAVLNTMRGHKESLLKADNDSSSQNIRLNYGLSEVYDVSSKSLDRKAVGQQAVNIVRRWLYDAVNFIKNNASEEEDFLLADKLCRMMNEGKIQLDDTHNRHETLDFSNSAEERIAFFDPYRNTITGKQRNIIVLDTKKVWERGYANLIDSLAHEGWHAVQEEYGLITVNKNNQILFARGFDLVKIELGAYNMGRKMHDRYAEQNGMMLLGPLSEADVKIIVGEYDE